MEYRIEDSPFWLPKMLFQVRFVYKNVSYRIGVTPKKRDFTTMTYLSLRSRRILLRNLKRRLRILVFLSRGILLTAFMRNPLARLPTHVATFATLVLLCLGLWGIISSMKVPTTELCSN